MIGLKRRDMNYIMKVGAKAQGVSVSEFRAMLQDTIDKTMDMLQHLFNNWFTKLDIQKMSAAAVMMAAAVSILLFLLERWNERQET